MKTKIDFTANLVAIAQALAAHGIHHVEVTYSGSGDSGDGFETSAYDKSGLDVDMPDVTVTCDHKVYRRTSEGHGYAIEPVELSLESAIDDALNEAINAAGHQGWENNEGGEGSLFIYASGFAELKHTSFYEGDAITDGSTYGPDSTFGASLAAMAAIMKKHGCVLVEAEYSGSGDSGDNLEVYHYGKDNEHLDIEIEDDVTYKVQGRVYANGRFKNESKDVTASFGQAVEDLCFSMVSASGHDGWENNEGGGGKLKIFDNGTAELEHYDNGEATGDPESTTWNDHLRQEGDEAEEA